VVTAPPSTTQPTAPSGPATAALALAGDAKLTGDVANLTIRCGTPSFDGLTIDMFGVAADPTVNLRVTLVGGKVTVGASSGQGTSYAARTFAGTVSGFDPAIGATIDTPLSEVPGGTANMGKLGALTSLKGKVACGNQAAGSSSLTVNGVIPEGTIQGGLDPVSVECITFAGGDRVSVIGMTRAGSSPVLIVMTLQADSISVAAWPNSLKQSRFFNTTAKGSVTLSTTGAHVDGKAAEPYATASPLTLTVAGDVTCGFRTGG
jgi:hypothetical protein